MGDEHESGDGSGAVRAYQPSNGTEGDIFMGEFCCRCACEPHDLYGDHDGCPILADTMAYKITDPDYPPEWIERLSDGKHTCTAFRERPEGWDGVPDDPRAVQAKEGVYDALPRDPITGRPVI